MNTHSKTLLLSLFTLLSGISHSQTTVNFTTTGNQQWTVPACVSTISIVMEGGEGGGVNGGNGAVLTGTVNVMPGDVISFNIGGVGGNGPGSGGYNGGGSGQASTLGWPSSGGGGATTLSVNGTPTAVAGGGGGTGGGDSFSLGGAGGCPGGGIGNSPFGQGGGGGTLASGGLGGPPWTVGGGTGGNGTIGNGGAGGIDVNFGTAPGGGGGGGVFGGGGGGSDNIGLTWAIGGGGGGGGSSLVPGGWGCAQTGLGNGSVSITFSGGITATASNTGPYCEGETIQLNGPGGVATYIYNWTGPNGFTSNLQSPTIPSSTVAMDGIYQLILTDANCTQGDTVTTDVVVNAMPTVDPIADQILCQGDNTLPVVFTGVLPGASYDWTNNNVNTGLAANGTGDIASFPGDATGLVEVSLIDVTPSTAFCTGTPEQFSITVLPTPTVSVSNDTTICENGTATLVAVGAGGGGGPYIYNWDFTTNLDPIQIINPTASGTYSVFIENGFGCVSGTETIEVLLFEPLSGTITPYDTICPGYPTAITAGVIGGMGTPYNYTWSSGENQTTGNFHTISANPPATQMYTVTITDACESTPLVMQTEIWVAPLPVPSYNVLDPEQCEPAEFNIVNTTDPALSQYVYWLVDGEQEFLNQNQILTDSLWAGSYDIQMIVTSYMGCVDSLTFLDALEVKPKPKADFRYSPNPVLMFNTTVSFQNYSLNGHTYQWFFDGGYPSTSTLTDVTVQYPDGQTGTYDVMLITTSELGCVDTTWQQVVVFPEVLIYAPNSFTPDDDEFNQDWRIFMEGIDIYDFELLIFDRWGEVLWESHDIEVGWDGMYAGKPLPAGTYSWVVRTKDVLNDAKYTYTGHVNILR